MQTTWFATMNESLCEKLKKKKHPSGTSFFHQFEQSYWDGNLKLLLSSHLRASHPRTNNGLERHNQHIKDKLTFNQLMCVNEFLHSIITWLSRESKSHCNLHADSLIEHILNKSSKLAISRIRNIWREGKNHNCNFFKKTNFSCTFKSRYSRRHLEQMNVLKLHQDHSRAIATTTFDEELWKF